MISIIMPIYNRAHLVLETLESIAAQTYDHWECIIVDDGSTDNTLQVLQDFTKQDSRFKVFSRPKHVTKGPSACRNYAVTHSSGDYIQYFDSDDIMHKEHLSKKLVAIVDHDAVVCRLKSFRESVTEISTSEIPSEPVNHMSDYFEGFTTGTFPMMMVAPMWRAISLKRYLPIREDLHLLEDHELYARVLSDPKKIAIIDEELIYYRIGLRSTSNDFFKKIATGLESYLKAKATVIGLTTNKKVHLATLKMILGLFRQALAERDFKSAQVCWEFLEDQNLWFTTSLQLKKMRIYIAYQIFKIVKRGDTRFKPLFKL